MSPESSLGHLSLFLGGVVAENLNLDVGRGLIRGRLRTGRDEKEMDIMFQTNVLGMIHLVSTGALV